MNVAISKVIKGVGVRRVVNGLSGGNKLVSTGKPRKLSSRFMVRAQNPLFKVKPICSVRFYNARPENTVDGPLMGLDEFSKLIQDINKKDGVETSANETPEQKAERLSKLRALTVPAPSVLDRVVKLELLQKETPEKVKEIWQAYHKSKYCVSGIIPRDQFFPIFQKIEALPTFAVPLLRKDGGIEFFFFQQVGNMWLFTPLSTWQANGASAKPCFSVAFYTELADDHQIVLMRSNVDPEILDIMECQFLINRVQASYLDPVQYQIVKDFHENPTTFDWSRLLIDLPGAGSPATPHVHGPNCNHDHDHDHDHSPKQ